MCVMNPTYKNIGIFYGLAIAVIRKSNKYDSLGMLKSPMYNHQIK